MKRVVPLLFILSLSSMLTLAQKAQSYTTTLVDLSHKLEAAGAGEQVLQVAVVPFVNLQPEATDNFGEYITQSVIGKLSDLPKRFKLFERKRLDAILSENNLTLSGLMKPSEAIKIGKLASVNALFSGTYIKLKSYIDINGRLIDVVSGEILCSYNGRIKLTDDLETLFEQKPPAPAATEDVVVIVEAPRVQTEVIVLERTTPEQICNDRMRLLKNQLSDIATEAKVANLVADYIEVPFDLECNGRLHSHIMYVFKNNEIKNVTYYEFLLKTLNGIANPTYDNRATRIVDFITYDGVSKDEWSTILSTISRLNAGHGHFLASVFKSVKSSSLDARQYIDAYFDYIKVHKIGQRDAVSFNYLFFEIMSALNDLPALQAYVYERYSNKLKTDAEEHEPKHLEYLTTLYKTETDASAKTRILKWMATYFNQFKHGDAHTELYDLALKFDPETPKDYNKQAVEQRNREKSAIYSIADLELLIALCKERFSDYASKAVYASDKTARIDFCIKYGIPVPGIIPSMPEAEALLRGNDLEEILKTMKQLVQMQNKPASLEGTLIALLDKRSLEERTKLTEIQRYAMTVLGNIKTSNPKAINYMMERIMSAQHLEEQAAREALANIGKAAVLPLSHALEKTTPNDAALRNKLILLLGKIGPDARAAVPLLKKLLQQAQSGSDFRYTLEAALQAIQ